MNFTKLPNSARSENAPVKMNSEMKNMSTLLILALLCSVELVSSTQSAETGKDCCMRYETKRVPLSMVVSFFRTSSSCAKPAIVFVTKRGRKICMNPSDAFVSSQVDELDRRSTLHQ
ncbi:hypothetical protein JZ751_021043 [Albula glossodonta]|uniref:Chemokine interleukin-8-like domain-containing protein n=1 Tax=Albula glossodonta TaxID=121402 RepID=A0A8T2PK15_9TELE|nr:hypothetical protein JZ751_021043 [Albula glossodonta]